MKKEENLFKRILKDTVKLVGAQSIHTIASFCYSYFVAIALGPALLGILQTSRIIAGYAGLSSLSLPFVVRREIPQLRSEGKEEEAQDIASVVFSYSVFASAFFSICLALCALFVENRIFQYCLFVTAILININAFSSFGNIITKGLNRYDVLSKITIYQSILTFLIIPFVFLFNIHAALWGQVLISVISAIIYFRTIPYGYRWNFDFPLLRKLIFIALPLFLSDAAGIIFESIDKVIIASLSSFENVGYYSLSSLLTTPIVLLTSSLSLVIFTHLNEKFGKDTSANVIENHIIKPQEYIKFILPFLIVVLVTILPLLVKIFLPKFEKGILAAEILVFGIYFNTTSGFASNALFVLNQQKRTAIVFLITGLINTFFAATLMKLGYGIEGVAFSTAITYFLYNSSLYYIVLRLIGRSKLVALIHILKNDYPVFISIAFVLLISTYFNLNFNSVTLLRDTFYSASILIVVGIPIIIRSKLLYLAKEYFS